MRDTASSARPHRARASMSQKEQAVQQLEQQTGVHFVAVGGAHVAVQPRREAAAVDELGDGLSLAAPPGRLPVRDQPPAGEVEGERGGSSLRLV
ncbi:hypothetical protein ACQEVG_37095 [Streptomyces sp. CA-135486]|uniref:hypothetical protein n=1 Tax=Streptomyces sp. CA-135486 TaxID=3240049 RepID=UPI003D8E2547